MGEAPPPGATHQLPVTPSALAQTSGVTHPTHIQLFKWRIWDFRRRTLAVISSFFLEERGAARHGEDAREEEGEETGRCSSVFKP